MFATGFVLFVAGFVSISPWIRQQSLAAALMLQYDHDANQAGGTFLILGRSTDMLGLNVPLFCCSCSILEADVGVGDVPPRS